MTEQERAFWQAVYQQALGSVFASPVGPISLEQIDSCRLFADDALRALRASEAVLTVEQVQAEDRSNRQLATLNAVVRELLSERDNAGYVPDGLCVAIGWPDPIMLVNLSTKAKP